MTAPVAGVRCVLFALFDEGGRLDRALMRAQVAWVREAGADGVVVLGLATEAGKLSVPERHALLAWAAEDARAAGPGALPGGPLPLWATIAGADLSEQRDLLRAAEGAGAALAILQPPLGEGGDLVDHFARLGEGAGLPLAVQNAPALLGRSLSHDDLARLAARIPLAAVKAEMPAVDLADLGAVLPRGVALLSGRGGIEMTDCLRAGATGLIVAPDVLGGVIRCHRLWAAGDEAGAEAAYAALLPAATFGMQSLGHLAAYGKRVWAARAGLPVHDRAPALRPTAFGLAAARRWAGGG